MNTRSRTDLLLLVAFCGFLFFYGLGAFGLLGADEPRYAQVAREMLKRHDWVTPTLQGKPWLEKPVLYYWQAMASYSVFGVSDSAARIPGAVDTALLIAAIYFFLRQLRLGSETDGALIAAGCAGIIGFGRGASTDMPLTSMFGIAMLGWYFWYETKKKTGLVVFYFFLALAMLAKGPVALFFAGVLVLLFAALRKDWRAIAATLWIPGIALFLLVGLPWYAMVQLRNPEFFRVFILEHNLGRFGQDLYHHRQPFWFYIPVLLLGMMPWTLWLLMALVERFRLIWSEKREAFATNEDAFQMFLLIWLFIPIIFFSASRSKLPGYILPAIPAGALLISEHLRERRNGNGRVSAALAITHGLLSGLVVFGALATPGIQINHRLTGGTGTYLAAMAGLLVAIGIAAALARTGLRALRPATLVAIVISAAALLKLAAPALDDAQSARPIAQTIQSFSHEAAPVALYHANRQQEYGLEFYLNRSVTRYESGDAPKDGHVLVAAQNSQAQFAPLLPGRHVSFLTTIPAQHLDLYWVGPSQ